MRKVALGVAGVAVFLALWEALRVIGILSPRTVAFPSTFAAYLAGAPNLAGFGKAIIASTWQLAAGLALGAGSGVVLGVLLGWYARAGRVLEPTVVAINAVPLIATIPLMILIVGAGAAAAITIVALFAFFPVYFAVSSAVAGVDPKMVQMARSFGGSDRQVLAGIVIPTIVPAIIAGLRLSIGRALTGLVVVELFMGQGGLGSVILDAVNQGMPNLAMLAVAIMGVANAIASGLLLMAQHRLEPWRTTPA